MLINANWKAKKLPSINWSLLHMARRIHTYKLSTFIKNLTINSIVKSQKTGYETVNTYDGVFTN